MLFKCRMRFDQVEKSQQKPVNAKHINTSTGEPKVGYSYGSNVRENIKKRTEISDRPVSRAVTRSSPEREV